MQVSLIGIDLAKNVFQLCGVNQAGKPIFNRTVKRNALLSFLKDYPDASIAMEACSGSNYWGRTLQNKGYRVMLIPPIHVKPFVKGNKNDRNDAFAITEAAKRPNMRFVEPRSIEQTDMMMLHKLRQRRVAQRVALTNQLRGFLTEYGLVCRVGRHALLSALPDLLEDDSNELTANTRALIQSIWDEWRMIESNIETLDKQIQQVAITSEAAKRLMKIKGVADKTATAMIAYAGNGKGYKNGRHFSANIGLVPKESSSGGKQNLGSITRRGNKYIRYLLIQGAWSVVRYAKTSDDRLSRWASTLIERRGQHKTVIAVANKLARIIWSMLYHQTEYQPG